MLHEPCLGNSIASSQGLNDGGLQFGFFLPGVTCVLSQSFRRPAGQLPFFPDPLWNSAFDRAFVPKVCGVGGMNDGAELATAGLVAVFAAVLLLLRTFLLNSNPRSSSPSAHSISK